MSPRGVLDRSVRERLLATTARLLETAAPESVTVRVIAREAGVSAGLLYNYFADRDELIVAVVLDQFRTQAVRAAELRELVGANTVQDNLVAYGRGIVGTATIPLARLLASRSDLAHRIRVALDADDQPGFDTLDQALASYLQAEQEQGRVGAGVDTTAASELLISAWHQMLLHDQQRDLIELHHHVNRLVNTLMCGLSSS